MLLAPRHAARIARAFLTHQVPVYAHFGITHRCDLRCRMCGIWRYGDRAEEMSLAEIRRMAALFRRLGVVQVSIGGGEPFSREDLEQAAAAFVRQGLRLRILTNAVNVPRSRFEACIDAGVRDFSVSLDSLYPSRFDAICEHPGAWDSAVRSMTFLSERLAGRGGLRVINCVVSNLNLEELPEMVRFARALGFAISLLPVELLPDPKAGVRSWEARFVRYRPEMGMGGGPPGQVAERVDRVYDRLVDMKRGGWPILNSTPYLEASRTYLATGRFPPEGCDAGRLYFSVSPNGQFTICHRGSHAYRHVLDPGFEGYFRSAAYERARSGEAGACEGCMRACWIDTSAIFHTIRGFFETARLNLRGAPPAALHEADALAWARTEHAGATAGSG